MASFSAEFIVHVDTVPAVGFPVYVTYDRAPSYYAGKRVPTVCASGDVCLGILASPPSPVLGTFHRLRLVVSGSFIPHPAFETDPHVFSDCGLGKTRLFSPL